MVTSDLYESHVSKHSRRVLCHSFCFQNDLITKRFYGREWYSYIVFLDESNEQAYMFGTSIENKRLPSYWTVGGWFDDSLPEIWVIRFEILHSIRNCVNFIFRVYSGAKWLHLHIYWTVFLLWSNGCQHNPYRVKSAINVLKMIS